MAYVGVMASDGLHGAGAEAAAAQSLAVRGARTALAVVYSLLVLGGALVAWQLVVAHSERHIVAWAVSALFVGVTVPLALHEVHLHLLAWTSPLQVMYCRILLMPPLYAVESWCALRFRDQALYFSVAREAYEALVIRDFYTLLLAALSNGTGDVRVVAARFRLAGRREAHMLPPLHRAVPWRLDNGEFFTRTRAAVFQYVAVRVVMAVAVFAAALNGTYGEGEWTRFDRLYVWSVLILNASQFVAMWALISLYHETAELLAPLRPLPKLLAVKAVVFLSFWQSVLLSGLVALGVITATDEWSTEEIATGLQNTLICAEMAFAAVAHHFTFSVDDFRAGRHAEGALGAGAPPGAGRAAGGGAGGGGGVGGGAGGGGAGGERAGSPLDAAADGLVYAFDDGGDVGDAGSAAGGGLDARKASAASATAAAAAAAAGGTPDARGVARAAAQLLPTDVLAEASDHAAALGAALGSGFAAGVRGGRDALLGRAPPIWTVSSSAAAAGAVVAGAGAGVGVGVGAGAGAGAGAGTAAALAAAAPAAAEEAAGEGEGDSLVVERPAL